MTKRRHKPLLLAVFAAITLFGNDLLLPVQVQAQKPLEAATAFALLGQLEALANNLPNKISYEGSSMALSAMM
ncbi:MAG: hypothetical protein IT342_25715 [Candidatus Melainabacteria bacterium]|nr:hypothetical protein [Candidatus Melainabacteria bacterium]